MAQPITCDICLSEQAVQMLTNLQDGSVIAVGGACTPVFYGHLVLGAMEAGEHKGLPQKCQACRRMHEQMMTAMTAAAAPPGPGDDGPRDQAVTGDDAAAAGDQAAGQ